jgi:hypothetical protein
MIKVRILDRWEFCDGEAYIFDYEDVDMHETRRLTVIDPARCAMAVAIGRSG